MATTDKDTPEYWLDQITRAKQRESVWRNRAKEIQELYDGEKENRAKSFNVLWANTQTLLPSLYSDIPKPEIRNRWYADNPIAKAVSTVLERGIEYSLDFLNVDRIATEAVLDYLVPGRATIRVRYRPFFGEGDPVKFQVEQGEDGALTANGKPVDEDTEILGESGALYINGPGEERKVYEEVFFEHVYWEDFLHGEAKKWARVPWVAFRHELTKEDLKEQYGRAKAASVAMTSNGDNEEATAEVWEIWDKVARKVCVVSEGTDDFLERIADPLQLEAFFPCPEPAYSVPRSGSLLPKPEYTLYQHLADEVDELTQRIQSVANAIRGRGAYPKEMGELMNLLEDSSDGELIPVENWSMFMEKGGLAGVVDWLPVKEMAEALVVLVRERNNAMQTIYEITGISDILRGTTDPRETARAQGLKAQFGTRRLRLKQRDIQRMFRDVYRLMAEIMAEHFDAQTFTLISGIPVTEQHVKLMNNDVLRTFSIDIETDSTIAADEQKEKQDVMEFMGAMGQMMQGSEALSKQLGPDATKGLVLAAVRRFKFSREVEDLIRNSKPPPPQPTPEQQLDAQKEQRLAMEGQAREQSRAQEVQAKSKVADATVVKLSGEAAKSMSDALDDKEQKVSSDA